MLRVITTFNDKLYRASAKSMLQTVSEKIPVAEILVYHELKNESCDQEFVRVDQLPEFNAVWNDFRDFISEDFGGNATDLDGWNRRWFGRYRKVCAQYDALVRRPTKGLTLWLDTDIRINREITENFIRDHLDKPIGLFRGSRDNVDAGYIIFDEEKPEAKRFIERCMEIYTSGEFLNLEKWSDSDVLAHAMDEDRSIVQDFADTRAAIRYQNSNEHETEGQIIPQSIWRDYLEHDKGQTKENGIVDNRIKPPYGELTKLCLNQKASPHLKQRPIVGIFLPEDNDLHLEALRSFQRGVQSSWDQSFIADLKNGWVDCDVAVTFGIYKAQWKRGRQIGDLMHSIAEHSAAHIVLERGFIQREDYFMVGLGGLNNRAEFFNEKADSSRAENLGITLSPWEQTGERVIVCGQVPWDSSVQHISFPAFIDETIRQLSEYTDREIVFRPHPQHPQAIGVSQLPCTISAHERLTDDLKDAFAIVTFNSNSAVEAAIAGIPVFAFDEGSMAWPIANSDLRKINQPEMPDRKDWLQQLTYTQWNLAEMSAGLPWRHFRKHLVSSEQPPHIQNNYRLRVA